MGLVSFQPGILHTFVRSAAELKCPGQTSTPAQGSTQHPTSRLKNSISFIYTLEWKGRWRTSNLYTLITNTNRHFQAKNMDFFLKEEQGYSGEWVRNDREWHLGSDSRVPAEPHWERHLHSTGLGVRHQTDVWGEVEVGEEDRENCEPQKWADTRKHSISKWDKPEVSRRGPSLHPANESAGFSKAVHVERDVPKNKEKGSFRKGSTDCPLQNDYCTYSCITMF